MVGLLHILYRVHIEVINFHSQGAKVKIAAFIIKIPFLQTVSYSSILNYRLRNQNQIKKR